MPCGFNGLSANILGRENQCPFHRLPRSRARHSPHSGSEEVKMRFRNLIVAVTSLAVSNGRLREGAESGDAEDQPHMMVAPEDIKMATRSAGLGRWPSTAWIYARSLGGRDHRGRPHERRSAIRDSHSVNARNTASAALAPDRREHHGAFRSLLRRDGRQVGRARMPGHARGIVHRDAEGHASLRRRERRCCPGPWHRPIQDSLGEVTDRNSFNRLGARGFLTRIR